MVNVSAALTHHKLKVYALVMIILLKMEPFVLALLHFSTIKLRLHVHALMVTLKSRNASPVRSHVKHVIRQAARAIWQLSTF